MKSKRLGSKRCENDVEYRNVKTSVEIPTQIYIFIRYP